MSVTVNHSSLVDHPMFEDTPHVHELRRDGKLIGLLLLDRAESEVIARGLRRMQATVYDPTTDVFILRWPNAYEILMPGGNRKAIWLDTWDEVEQLLDDHRHDVVRGPNSDEPTVLITSDRSQTLEPLMRTPDGWET